MLRLLRGEDLELLSRELGVVASTLSLWREEFLAAGQAALKGKTVITSYSIHYTKLYERFWETQKSH